MKPNGLMPNRMAFIYKTVCLSRITYAINTYDIKEQTIKEINIKQNNIIRYLLEIPQSSHISDILKVLQIADIKTVINICLCSYVKQLHRHPITKSLITQSNDSSIIEKINKMSRETDENEEEIKYRPDVVKKSIVEKYSGERSQEEVRNIKECLSNYSNYNRMVLKTITKSY